jgi:hypothetical protein
MAQVYLWEISEWNVKKNPGIVFTFTRQRWSSTYFSDWLLPLPVWRSNILNIPHPPVSYLQQALRLWSNSCLLVMAKGLLPEPSIWRGNPHPRAAFSRLLENPRIINYILFYLILFYSNTMIYVVCKDTKELRDWGRGVHGWKRTSVGNFSPIMGARNQVNIGLSYRPASLCSLATPFQARFLESIPRPMADLSFRLRIPTIPDLLSVPVSRHSSTLCSRSTILYTLQWSTKPLELLSL